MEEIKMSLNFMCAELTKLASQQELPISLTEEVKLLKVMIRDRDKKVTELQQEVHDQEKYTR